MFFQDTAEEKLKVNEKKMRELAIRLEKLDSDISAFLEELNVTPEQLTSFVSNKDNFTDSNWIDLQAEKKKLDEKLNTELKNIRNPLKSKKNLASLNVSQHWLYVK